MTRSETLDAAKNCVCGSREEDYGNPEYNFILIARFWQTYLIGKGLAVNITSEDVAVMMALLKVARIATGKKKDDNYVDGAGYFACAAECALEK